MSFEPPRALATEAQAARLFVERSLALLPWLSIEDAFCLPRGECCDPLPLHLFGTLPGTRPPCGAFLERLPLEDLGEEVRASAVFSSLGLEVGWASHPRPIALRLVTA